MDSIERSAKTVDKAISEALIELDVARELVEVKVLSEGNRGIFGIGAKPAKVLVTVPYNPENVARRFLTSVVSSVGLSVRLDITRVEKYMNIMMHGQDIGILIGKRGQTLDSLQHLVGLVVNRGRGPYINILLDAENYRHKRKETLEALAYNLVAKAKATQKKVVLEPMTSQERRIIHAAIQYEKSIDTYSEGTEPYRYVVIMPK